MIKKLKKKINFSERMANASRKVVTKRRVGNALDLGDKSREKHKTFDLSYFIA